MEKGRIHWSTTERKLLAHRSLMLLSTRFGIRPQHIAETDVIGYPNFIGTVFAQAQDEVFRFCPERKRNIVGFVQLPWLKDAMHEVRSLDSSVLPVQTDPMQAKKIECVIDLMAFMRPLIEQIVEANKLHTTPVDVQTLKQDLEMFLLDKATSTPSAPVPKQVEVHHVDKRSHVLANASRQGLIPSAARVVKTEDKPMITLIGLSPQQRQDTIQEFGAIFDLRFYDREAHGTILNWVHKSVRVYALVMHVSHDLKAALHHHLKERYIPIQSGLSALKRDLRQYAADNGLVKQ